MHLRILSSVLTSDRYVLTPGNRAEKPERIAPKQARN